MYFSPMHCRMSVFAARTHARGCGRNRRPNAERSGAWVWRPSPPSYTPRGRLHDWKSARGAGLCLLGGVARLEQGKCDHSLVRSRCSSFSLQKGRDALHSGLFPHEHYCDCYVRKFGAMRVSLQVPTNYTTNSRQTNT
jgi:hypothetical protein